MSYYLGAANTAAYCVFVVFATVEFCSCLFSLSITNFSHRLFKALLGAIWQCCMRGCAWVELVLRLGLVQFACLHGIAVCSDAKNGRIARFLLLLYCCVVAAFLGVKAAAPPSLARWLMLHPAPRGWCRQPWPYRACRRLCRRLVGQQN